MNLTLKTCPRCKGLGYILGQRKQYKTLTYHLPNYKKNKKGLCFLCDGKKEAYFTEDHKVIKIKKNKSGDITLVEFCPATGQLIGEIPKSSIPKYLNTYNNTVVSTPRFEYNPEFHNNNDNFIDIYKSSYREEDILFPKEAEFIFGQYSSKIDNILKENPNSRAVSIDRFLSDEGDTLNFLMYYDSKFNLIEPSHIISSNEEKGCLMSGIVSLDNGYSIAVSGTYYIDLDRLYIGIKTQTEFKSVKVHNICDIVNIYKNKKIRKIDIMNFITGTSPIHPLTVKVLLNILDYCHLDIQGLQLLSVF